MARQQGALRISEMTGQQPKMWGERIVGFGKMTYTNTTGENEWMMIGFAPRKQALTLDFVNGFKNYDSLMKKLASISAANRACI